MRNWDRSTLAAANRVAPSQQQLPDVIKPHKHRGYSLIRSHALVSAVAKRLIGSGFAAAQPYLLGLRGGKFLWR